MQKLMLFLIISITAVFVAVPTTASPAGASSESTPMVTQVISFAPEYNNYQFRVVGGQMSCEARLRHFRSGGIQVVTARLFGNCTRISMRVDRGHGFGSWLTTRNTNRVLREVSPLPLLFKAVEYRLCGPSADGQSTLCTGVLRRHQ